MKLFSTLALLMVLMWSLGGLDRADAAVVVTVKKLGTGKGTISSTPTGLSCTATCVLDFLYVPGTGGPVTVTVVPDVGSRVTKWSVPSCTGASCQLIVAGSQTVTVTIDKIPGVSTPTTSIGLAPTVLSFSAQHNGPQAPKQSLIITTSAAWTATNIPSWLRLALVNPTTLSVSVIQTGLVPGVYPGSITFKASNVPTVTVPVTLTVTTTPVTSVPFAVSSTTASIQGRQFGKTGTNPAPKTILVNGVSTFSAVTSTPWIRLDRFKGSFNIQVLLPGVLPGSHQGTVTVTSTESTLTHTVTVTLVVSQAPTLLVFPASLSFQTSEFRNFQTVSIANIGTGSLGSLSVSTTLPKPVWLSLTSTPTTLIVHVNPTGLAVGSYPASVTLSSTTSLNGPITIPITLVVNAALTVPNSVTLAWDKNIPTPAIPVTGYRLYRSTVSGVYTGPPVLEVPHPITLAEIYGGMPSGSSYFFTVTAFNGGGESPRSNEVFITFTLPILTP